MAVEDGPRGAAVTARGWLRLLQQALAEGDRQCGARRRPSIHLVCTLPDAPVHAVVMPCDARHVACDDRQAAGSGGVIS